MDATEWTLKTARALWGRDWQKRLAPVIGVSVRTIGYWASGVRSPRLRHIEALALHVVSRSAFLRSVAQAAPVDPSGAVWAITHALPQVTGGAAAGEMLSEQWRGPPPPTSGVPCPWAMSDADLEALVVGAAALPPLPAPLQVELETGGFSVPDDVPPAAAAPRAPARGPGRPRKPPTPEKIAAALEDRGYKIRDRGSYPKWYDASMRAKDDADRAAGRVVYTDELMQHAGILDE